MVDFTINFFLVFLCCSPLFAWLNVKLRWSSFLYVERRSTRMMYREQSGGKHLNVKAICFPGFFSFSSLYHSYRRQWFLQREDDETYILTRLINYHLSRNFCSGWKRNYSSVHCNTRNYNGYRNSRDYVNT